MNRLAKNRGAQTLVLLAFLAFFAHSMKICRFRFEFCDACKSRAVCAERAEISDRSNCVTQTSKRAVRSVCSKNSLNSPSLSRLNETASAFEAQRLDDSPLFCGSPCDEKNGDSCFLTFSPIKKNDSRVVFAALADAFAPSPIFAPSVRTPRRFEINPIGARLDAVPIYLRWETLLI